MSDILIECRMQREVLTAASLLLEQFSVGELHQLLLLSGSLSGSRASTATSSAFSEKGLHLGATTQGYNRPGDTESNDPQDT